MPRSFTPFTMSTTRSNIGPSFTSRQAAPMQKRVEPSSFARFALAMTLATSSIFSALTFVSYLLDCGQ